MSDVLFVCTGNICRSPMAEAVLREMLAQQGIEGVKVDSAGTHAYHLDEAPDMRAQITAQARGYDLSALKARQLIAEDFERFAHIIIMDGENKLFIQRQFHDQDLTRVRKLLSYAPDLGTDVPDPYYGNDDGFENVYQILNTSMRGFLAYLQEQQLN